MFPSIRLRRNRYTGFIRNLVQENNITVNDLVYPVFVIEGNNIEEEIISMPGQKRLSLDRLLVVAQKCINFGIPAIGIFPVITSHKTLCAKESYNPQGLVQRAIKTLKQNFPQLGVFTDIALDPYTIHGHDGILDDATGIILNDLTNKILVKQALSHVECGADFVCPSDMMDGRIGKIRDAFEENNFHNSGIIAYSAKYASNFYGPFRDAIGSKVAKKIDKANYQMNPANSNEAIHEVSLDINEGADIVMIKPGMPYLDIILRIKTEFKKPTAVYQVSGEYAMLKAASLNGWLDYDKCLIETMLSFKRSGADMIWTYAALEVAEILCR